MKFPVTKKPVKVLVFEVYMQVADCVSPATPRTVVAEAIKEALDDMTVDSDDGRGSDLFVEKVHVNFLKEINGNLVTSFEEDQ